MSQILAFTRFGCKNIWKIQIHMGYGLWSACDEEVMSQ